MDKEEPTPVADATEVELTQGEEDALLAAQDGVNGALTVNGGPSVQEEKSEPEGDAEKEEGTTVPDESNEVDKPAPELEKTEVEEPVLMEDPGEFTPGDYSFQIITKDGKSHNIKTIEQADKLATKLDDTPENISASQFMLLNRKTAAMERGLDDDRRAYETKKAEFANEQTIAKAQEAELINWSNELKYLTANDEIPAVPKDIDVPGGWDEHPEDPGVKARLEIFKWMDVENKKRSDAGLQPVTSVISAFKEMQLENLKKGNKETATKEKEQRQKKGSMVGGSSSYQPSNTPPNTIIGTGGSLDDMITEYMNQ